MSTYSPPTTDPSSAPDSLTADARALLDATANSASEGISDARKRLNAALEGGKRVYCQVKEQVVEGAKATDTAIHAHPYYAILAGVGVGALLGFLISRRSSH